MHRQSNSFHFYRRAKYEESSSKRRKRDKGNIICWSAKNDNAELQEQKDVLDDYAKANGRVVVRTYIECGTMGTLTYNNFRLQAKYHEFDELLITELSVIGNSSVEIIEEISCLVENSIKVLSIKDGELNVETLPSVFRKNFRLNKNIKTKTIDKRYGLCYSNASRTINSYSFLRYRK